jgi:hypothetical protein
VTLFDKGFWGADLLLCLVSAGVKLTRAAFGSPSKAIKTKDGEGF